MSRKFRTKAAAEFLASRGDRVSYRTLQGYRTRAPEDPGEHGPRWFRDTATAECWYFEVDLLEWIAQRNARLIERAPAAQPACLARDAA